MEIHAREVGPVTVLDLTGKLTLDKGSARLLDAIDPLLQGGTRAILINLDQVPYMDSAGIGALVASYKRALDRGATMKLLNPKKRVFDLLHLVKLDAIFECFQDERQAIASFATGQAP